MTELSLAGNRVEVVPHDYLVPLDLELIFGRIAPLEVDLGCGDGLFLASLAALMTERNFLGIERLLNRVRSTCRRIERERIENARVLRVENSHAVRYLFRTGSVAVFHLNFPDPWPKRRHHRRRLITEDFFDAVQSALKVGGIIRVTTDHLDYFQQIKQISGQIHGFVVEPAVTDLPATTFEKRFRDIGQDIYRLVLRKISDVR